MVAGSGDDRVVRRAATGSAFGPADLERIVGTFVASLPETPEALGIAFPGLVGDGAIVACDVLPRFVGWRPPPALTAPWRFAIVNDGEAALLAEARDEGPAATVAVIVVGTGIGAAFQVDGRVLRGARGWVGELGSIPIAAPDGVRTLDQLASGQAIVERAGCDGAEVERRALAGDPEIMAIVRDAGAALGLGIAAVLNLLDPAVVALGGGAIRLTGYLEAARETARAHTLPAIFDACVMRELRDGDFAAAVGAAIAANAAERP